MLCNFGRGSCSADVDRASDAWKNIGAPDELSDDEFGRERWLDSIVTVLARVVLAGSSIPPRTGLRSVRSRPVLDTWPTCGCAQETCGDCCPFIGVLFGEVTGPSRLLLREPDRGVTLALSRDGSGSRLEGADEGCSEGVRRLGVRYPPGVASRGVKGVFCERWKVALRAGVRGLPRWPVFCLSAAFILAGVEGRKGERLMALRQ